MEETLKSVLTNPAIALPVVGLFCFIRTVWIGRRG